MIAEMRDQVVLRLRSLLLSDHTPNILSDRILAVSKDEERPDGIIFVLENGKRVKAVLYDEEDRFCFWFDAEDREILIPKVAVLGRPN